MCLLEGKTVTPEMPGVCHKCCLYLNTCSPVVDNGYLTGAECDYFYCEDCPYYEECGW